MGASSPEIEQQIKETRQHLDDNLDVLERRAFSGAKRLARIGVAVGVGLAATAGVVLAVYTLKRRRSLAAKVRDAVPGSIRRLPRRFSVKLKMRPAVKALAVSAATAISSRMLRPRHSTTPPPTE